VPVVNVAVTLVGDPVADAGVGVGGLAIRPLRAAAVEQRLRGVPLDAGTIDQAAEALDASGLHPLDDMHGSADYRLRVARVLLRRTLADLA
jgi:carbon-monoxide dehydrogenase medium subunit